MTHYLKHFAAVYCIALTLLVTVLIFGLKLGGLSLVPTLIVSALITAGYFANKEQRLPTQHEKIQLIWGSSAIAIMIASFFVFFLVLMNPNAEQILAIAEKSGILLAAMIMLILIVLHAAIFFVAYNWYTPYRLKKLFK